MSRKLKVACYGVNGHQIVGKLAGHRRAEFVAAAEIPGSHLVEQLGPEAATTVRRVADLDELVSAEDVELISLCSPRRDEQCEHAIRCLRAGKHVMVEKPCGMTIEELTELQAAIRESEAQFQQMGATGQEAVLSAIRSLVDAGTLGEVVHVYALKSYPCHAGRPQDPGVDGGLIRQAGIHGVRFIQHATGLRAVRVCGFDTARGNPGTGDLRMAASVALELSGGAVALLACNYLNPTGFGLWGNDQLRVHGTAGMVEAVDGFQRCRLILGDSPPQDIAGVPDTRPDFFDSYTGHLLDGRPMPYSLDEDLYALRTVIRAQEAVDGGRTVEV